MTDTPDRKPLSATDLDRPSKELIEQENSLGPMEVLTPLGPRPFFPAEPELPQSDEYPQADNPFNPKGQPSMHLPQQATPLRTRPDGNADPSVNPTYTDPKDPVAIDPHATYVPYPGFTDNVNNPRGTPDYLIVGATPDYDGAGAGSPNTRTEPPTGAPDFDNPQNPRGIASSNCDGVPDAQAFDSQKAQNPTPARPPLAATIFPDPFYERVSAGQNRAPPQERIP
jgi:hypothetical protein